MITLGGQFGGLNTMHAFINILRVLKVWYAPYPVMVPRATTIFDPEAAAFDPETAIIDADIRGRMEKLCRIVAQAADALKPLRDLARA